MLSAMAYGYLDRALRTTACFRNLEQTEKVGVSFLLGQAFTHWFAQDRMDIKYLLHVAGLKSTAWGTSSAAVSADFDAVFEPERPASERVALAGLVAGISRREQARPPARNRRLCEESASLNSRRVANP